MKRFTLFFLVIPFWLCALDFAAELEPFIEAKRVEYQVPGLSIAIVQGDEALFIKGFGVMDAGKKEKVDSDTIFQLASVSKAFTADGLAYEVGKGAWEWDRPVIEELPYFLLYDPYPSRYATTRDLLAHRTGLPSFQGDLLGKLGYSREEIVERARFIPGGSTFREKALYSNVSYFLAGQLLASLSGKSYEKAISDTILTPLEMSRSGFSESYSKENVAEPHALIDGKIKTIPRDTSSVFAAAGGLSSSAKDMANWIAMHLNGGKFKGKEILKAAAVKELYSPSMVAPATFTELYPITEKAGHTFGMGWDVYHYAGHIIVEKGGALDGVRSVVTLIPELKLGIVVLANLNFTVLPELIRAKFLNLALGVKEPLDETVFKERGDMLAKLLKAPEIANPLSPTRPLTAFKGNYVSELYGTFSVDEKLNLSAGPIGFKGTLTHLGNDTFLLSWPEINMGHQNVTFVFDEEGRPSELQTEVLGIFKAK